MKTHHLRQKCGYILAGKKSQTQNILPECILRMRKQAKWPKWSLLGQERFSNPDIQSGFLLQHRPPDPTPSQRTGMLLSVTTQWPQEISQS